MFGGAQDDQGGQARAGAQWLPALMEAWRGRPAREGGPLEAGEVRRLGGALRALSDGLIGERGMVGAPYMSSHDSLGAYLVHFWPSSYAQAAHVLEPLEPLLAREGSRALDLGAGPGPVSAALLDAGCDEVLALEPSADAVRLIERASEGRVRGQVWDATRDALPEGPFDVITMSHVLNELWSSLEDEAALARRVALCEEALARLAPGGRLVLIEPALRETSRAALQVRDALVARGHVVCAPCTRQGACPALEDARDWCHAARVWSPPDWTHVVTRSAGMGARNRIKMTYLVFARAEDAPAPHDGRVFRIVSDDLHVKGRMRFIGCGEEGRVGLVLMKRDVTRHNKVFRHVQRGDMICITSTQPRGDGLVLQSDSTVALLS